MTLISPSGLPKKGNLMVVAEVLTGIALVQKSVEFIKSNIQTVNDIGDIASSIDDLFAGEQQAQKARNKKSGVNQFDVSSVAKETIDARIAAEHLYTVSVMVDQRFGHGTWAGIVSERARRIQEAKEAQLAARKAKVEKDKEFLESVKTFCITFGIIVAMAGLFVVMIWQITKE